MPTVSIIIPVHNGAEHIGLAIESVLAQAGIDREIIVVDNASTDATREIVAGYAARGVRLECNATNLGAEANWNRGLDLATGRYVKMLPHDDLVLPGALARQVAILDMDVREELALVFGSREIIDADGRTIARRGYGRARSGYMSARRLARSAVRRGTNPIGEPGAVLFRRSLAETIGRFDGRQGFVFDLDYWLRLLAHGDAYYLARPVAAFRVRQGSWSMRIGTAQAREYGAFLDRMAAAGLVPAGAFDLAIGKLAALANNLARLAFYRLVVR